MNGIYYKFTGGPFHGVRGLRDITQHAAALRKMTQTSPENGGRKADGQAMS
jgi:hypothetical protein